MDYRRTGRPGRPPICHNQQPGDEAPHGGNGICDNPAHRCRSQPLPSLHLDAPATLAGAAGPSRDGFCAADVDPTVGAKAAERDQLPLSPIGQEVQVKILKLLGVELRREVEGRDGSRRAPSGTLRTPRLGFLSRRPGRPRIVIAHAVKDVETWLTGKADRVAAFSPFASHVTDHVAMDGSNNVAITADVHDVAGAQAMLASRSPEIAAAMERHGVIQPVSAHIEK